MTSILLFFVSFVHMLSSVILFSVGDDSWRVADGVKFLHFVALRLHFSVFQRLYVFLNCIYIIVMLLAVSCFLKVVWR